jgi:glycosyltransferase involved in cell wall biosynthesis
MTNKNTTYECSTSPRVSVITIFLNGENFLAEAIESVIAQSFNAWELLLVDDGSRTAATTIAKSYAARHPTKIRYLEHPGHINRGMSVSRNLGIHHARGEYIAFIDADDVWLPCKLAEQVAILEKYPSVGLVCGTVIYWSSWSGGEDTTCRTGQTQDVVVNVPEALLTLYPLGTAPAPCPSDIMVRAKLVRLVAGFEEHFTAEKQMYEDQAFLAKVYLKAPVFFSSNVWLKYRKHSNSFVTTVRSAGKYAEVRCYFLNWFEMYLQTTAGVDLRVQGAIRRALRPYRNRWLNFIYAFLSKLRNQFRRACAFRTE